MNEKMKGGPGVATPEPAETPAATKPQSAQSQDATAVRVVATFYPPSGRRTLGALVVHRCPWCPSGGHVHRGNGGPRRSGCDRGDYILVARPALPARRLHGAA